jgi:MFS family permease
LLAAIGYGLAAFTKPVFPLATGLGWIVTARFVDRIGKGIRGAPRDALIADLTPAPIRGAAFGLRQSLDTAGAFIGPLLAVGLMALTFDNFTFVFWIAVIPALVSFGLIVVMVEEPARHENGQGNGTRLRLNDLSRLSAAFWLVVVLASVLTLARFSEAFLILRAQQLGMPVALVPLILVVMNIVYALSAYPAGALSDRLGRSGVLLAGIAALIAADLVLAFAPHVAVVLVGVALWGLHMGMTQGLLATLVADTAPADLRGTAFGIFNFASGLALLAASVIAGWLWDASGPAATFLAAAAVSVAALAGLAIVVRKRNTRPA